MVMGCDFVENYEALKRAIKRYKIPEQYLGIDKVVGKSGIGKIGDVLGSLRNFGAGTIAMGSHTGIPLELMKLMSEKKLSFYDVLTEYIDKSEYTKDSDVYNKAGISKAVFSKIRRGHIPKRTSILRIALVLKLSMDDAKRLLNSAGYSFLASNNFDKFISYVLEEYEKGKKYDYDILNYLCYETTGMTLLGEE